jgi:hypothetical protein
MNIWVVKCREIREDKSQGWHWKYYFDENEDGRDWGGEDWIRSTRSCKLIRDEVSRGDLVVCYQYEGRQITGLTLMAEDGSQEIRGGPYNMLSFVPSPKSFSLLDVEPPLTVGRLRSRGCSPKCFGPYTQGTIFPVDPEEFEGIRSAISDDYPKKRMALSKWLKKARYHTP